MPLTVAIQMDPIGSVDIRADTTFRLMLEGQERGHSLFYYHAPELAWEDGRLTAPGWPVEVRPEPGDHYTLGPRATRDLAEFDVVLLRQDPPFDMAYVTNTHLLEKIHPRTLVVNDPSWVRNCPEKLLVLDFPELIPPTMIARSLESLRAFRKRHGDMILKPLFGNGGAGIFKLGHADANLNALHELFLNISREPLIAQKYLPEIERGDKRVILIEGEPVGAINRMPAEGETRSNMHVGGKPLKDTLNDRDREICAAIGPLLRERGLTLAGIDVIGGWLTEINVTSPTGIQELERFDGSNVAALFWEAVERRRAASGGG